MRERAALQTRRVPHERGQKAAGTRIMRHNAVLGFTYVELYNIHGWAAIEGSAMHTNSLIGIVRTP